MVLFVYLCLIRICLITQRLPKQKSWPPSIWMNERCQNGTYANAIYVIGDNPMMSGESLKIPHEYVFNTHEGCLKDTTIF